MGDVACCWATRDTAPVGFCAGCVFTPSSRAGFDAFTPIVGVGVQPVRSSSSKIKVAQRSVPRRLEGNELMANAHPQSPEREAQSSMATNMQL